jgi:site-specific DNA recombinase
VEGQSSQLRQGVARLIDSYAEGLIEKGEFEPRVTRLRQRLARLEEQRQALAAEAALHAELQLIIGRLEDCAAKVHAGLEAADWASQRALIRALVKRVEVAQDDVNIVFRIDQYQGDPDLEKKSLQLCRGSDHTTLGVAQSASQEARQRASRTLARTYSESHAHARNRPVALFERVSVWRSLHA